MLKLVKIGGLLQDRANAIAVILPQDSVSIGLASVQYYDTSCVNSQRLRSFEQLSVY